MTAGTPFALRDSFATCQGELFIASGWVAAALERAMDDPKVGGWLRKLFRGMPQELEMLADTKAALHAAVDAWQAGAGSAEVSAEVVVAPSDPMTVTAAAALLNISPRQVRNLAVRDFGGVRLRAGGPYLLDRRLVEIDARRRKVES